MATGRNISQQSPFKGQPNRRGGGGPIFYKWNPLPFQKNGNLNIGSLNRVCNDTYDNIVTYVYDIDLSNGNHLAYVYCDYVI